MIKMGLWEKKANKLLPDFKKELSKSNQDLNQFFQLVLAVLNEIDKVKDEEKIANCFRFAEWCFRHKNEALWNEAGLFYQQVAQNEELTIKWIEAELYHDLRSLLQLTISEETLAHFDKHYAEVQKKAIFEALKKVQ